MIEVRGADQLAHLSKALKAAGRQDLQKELSRGISQALRPVIVAVRRSATQKLPNRGGLAAKVAKSRMRTTRETSQRGSGSRLQVANAYGLAQLDKGDAWHPVFGNRNVWVKQSVTSGWWTEPTEAAAPNVRRELQQAIDRVAAKIDRAT